MRFLSSIPAFAAVALPSIAHAQGQPQGYGPWPGMMGWGCGIGWPWPLMMLVFWIVVIAGIVYFVRFASRGRDRSSEETALDILKKRYARGEISKEEYEKIKKDIS